MFRRITNGTTQESFMLNQLVYYKAVETGGVAIHMTDSTLLSWPTVTFRQLDDAIAKLSET